jgi:ribonucleotide reductase alpha subunit
MTEKTSMDSIVFGLNLSQETLSLAKQVLDSTDSTFIEIGLDKLARNLENYDDFVLAGRILLQQIVRSVPSLETYLALNNNILDPKIAGFMETHLQELEALVKEHIQDNYTNQDYFSADTLRKSYLLRAVPAKGPTETPVQKNLRIAVQLYYDESMEFIKESFKEMCNGIYTHATPTIQNAGTKNGQMASCFLMSVHDSLDSMMYTGVGDMAMISRHSGGIGIGLTDIRHSDVAGTGSSAGVLPVARCYDKVISYVDQARKRRGAATGFLDVWHIDVEDFIRASSNYVPQDLRLVGLHACIWTHDLFWHRAIKGEKWTVFCPNTVKNLKGLYGLDFEKAYCALETLAPLTVERYKEVEAQYDAIRTELCHTVEPSEELKSSFVKATEELSQARKDRIVYKEINAQELVQLMADTQLKSGKPYIMNGDRANKKSNQQNIGPINNSNLCVEIVQYSDPETFSSCNLASLNLSAFGKKRFDGRVYPTLQRTEQELMEELKACYDFKRLGEITRHVTRNLNKVIDHNFYPFDESKIKNFNLKTRPLGLGISGLDDAFKVVDIVYGSPESILLNKMIFACMYYNSLLESCSQAKTHGEYHHFRTGKFKLYDPLAKDLKEYSGSPLSNGLFQFDLWENEYLQDRDLGRISNTYDPADNRPIDPIFFEGSMSWDDLRNEIKTHGVRNSLLIALMPTASVAHILRNAESAEAHQSNIYSRQVGNGSYNIVNRHLHADLEEAHVNTHEVNDFIYKSIQETLPDGKLKIVKASGCLNGLADHLIKLNQMPVDAESRVRFLEQKYLTMFDIKPTLFLKMARQRGIYVDQSQSTNIYIVDPSLAQLMGIQMAAYHNKLKTHLYYLRNTIPTQITGFNSKITEALTEPMVAKGTEETEETEVPMCKIDNPDCLSCQ